MTRPIHVEHEGGDRYLISIGDHQVLVDQPIDAGGTDAGPTPTEIWVAGLASCVGFYGGRFLARHGIDAEGFEVDCAWEMAEGRPARVGRIDVSVRLPSGFPLAKRERFQAVIDHCTVHNSIEDPPEVSITCGAPVRAGTGRTVSPEA
jgi:uncharacterized OsmC-like protein